MPKKNQPMSAQEESASGRRMKGKQSEVTLGGDSK